jgi:hypothetical protein
VAESRSPTEALEGLGAGADSLGDGGAVGYTEGAMMDAARIARTI